jgi:hypothetical protein
MVPNRPLCFRHAPVTRFACSLSLLFSLVFLFPLHAETIERDLVNREDCSKLTAVVERLADRMEGRAE